MMGARTQFGVLSLVGALVLATTGSASANPAPLDPALSNPFDLSRSNAMLSSDSLKKEPVPAESDRPDAGDGHLLANFVYYTSLQIQGGVSLLAGDDGFSGSGFIGGPGGGGSGGDGFGGSTEFGGDEEGGPGDVPSNPAPGAALLGMLGLSMTGWVRRRWA